MARLFPFDSEEWEWRSGLSEFQNVVHDVARPRSKSGNQKARLRLAELLCGDCVLTPEDRTTLADYFKGKLKRKGGRPKGKSSTVRLDWLGKAERRYNEGVLEWGESGGKRKVLVNGSKVSFKDNLINRLEAELRPEGDTRSLHEYLSRSFKRR